MVKVENKDTIRLLTKRFLKINADRNRIAILAIMLTSLLFTSLFMGCTSLILSKRAAEIKRSLDSSHASLQNAAAREQEHILQSLKTEKNISRYGMGMFLGSGADSRFRFSTEVRYGDPALAESFNCLPATGRLPRQADEIALSTLILDALLLPHQTGIPITLTWESGPDGQTQTDTFRLCGFWEGDKSITAQLIWVSEAYAMEHAYPVTKEELADGIYNGGWDYCVWFTKTAWLKNLGNLERMTNSLNAAMGFSGQDGFEYNPAYNLMEEDAFSYTSAAAMLLFILLAGFLIIYNIFNISIKIDIRAYGLLKNVGTTGKQLKQCVRMQAWKLSLIGIPLGLAGGYLAGRWMAPSLAANAEISAQAGAASETVVSAHPAIFIFAGLFTLLTVYLSVLQPCRIVKRVSPVEAVRLAENEHSRKKLKKNTSVSWLGMVFGNCLRNWKKGTVVMISISLSLVVVNCIVMLVQGYDFEAYKAILLASDFQLDQIADSPQLSNFQGITQSVKGLLEACPYGKPPGYVYYSDQKHKLNTGLADVLESIADKNTDNWSKSMKNLWKKIIQNQALPVHFMGINQSAFEKLEWASDTPASWEEFKTGDYVLADFDRYNGWTEGYYQKGSTFIMNYENGTKKEYKVLDEADLPYSLQYPFADFMYLTILVPEEEFIAQTQISSAMYAFIDAQGDEIQIKQYLDYRVLPENTMLNLFSILDMRKSFGRYISRYYTIGGCLVLILALIGILNYFNTSQASIISRKKELALLEAVGMTKKQLLKMLAAEGFIYLGGAFAGAVFVVICCSEQMLAATLGAAFFFRMKLTILPCAAMLPVLAVLAWAVPACQFRKMNQESVVERIRCM